MILTLGYVRSTIALLEFGLPLLDLADNLKYKPNSNKHRVKTKETSIVDVNLIWNFWLLIWNQHP